MKTLLISLALFIPATSALAESTVPEQGKQTEDQHTYFYHDNYNLPQQEPVYNDEPRFIKLLQIENNNQRIKTIKADISDRQRLYEAIA